MAREKRERANSVDDEVASVVSQASDNDKEVIVILKMIIDVDINNDMIIVYVVIGVIRP